MPEAAPADQPRVVTVGHSASWSHYPVPPADMYAT